MSTAEFRIAHPQLVGCGYDREASRARGEAACRAAADAGAVTFLERSSAGPRNVVMLFDARGREALTYAKVHTCSFDLPEQALAHGTEFPVARL